MTILSKNRIFLFLFLPALCFGALPLNAPLSMTILAAASALFSMTLLALCVYDMRRPAPLRPAIPFVWLSLAAGFGCISVMLLILTRTWGSVWHICRYRRQPLC
jgi:hypothetical protein